MTKTLKITVYSSVAVLSIASLLMMDISLAGARSDKAVERTESVVPAHAVEIAPGIYSLGESFDVQSGEMVEGLMIVHGKDVHAKPSGAPGNGGGKGGGGNDGGDTGGSETAECYGYIAKGIKWKTAEPWVVNPTNTYGITHDSIFSILDNGIDKWEDATDGVMDGNVSAQIIGEGATTSVNLLASSGSLDGINGVSFGNLDNSQIIGVTSIWWTRSGRRFLEWDQVYNTDFNWTDSATADPLAMDFDSIATHELGHTMGMSDLYTEVCRPVTMFGYGEEGYIDARDLADGDINGIDALY